MCTKPLCKTKRLSMIIWILFTYVIQTLAQVFPETVYTHSACYGTGDLYVYMDANCSLGTMLYPKLFSFGVKPLTSSCNESVDNPSISDYNQCCVRDQGDCFDSIEMESFPADLYFEACIGKTVCSKVLPQRLNIDRLGCNHSVYPGYTQYMHLQYYCIPNGKIATTSASSLDALPEETLYLVSGGYPSDGIDNMSECSIETECDRRISISALHIDLTNLNGSCTEEINVYENNFDTYSLNCNANRKSVTHLFTSRTNYLKIGINATGGIGRFWLAIMALGNTSLYCPKKDPVYVCPTTTTSTTPTTTSLQTSLETIFTTEDNKENLTLILTSPSNLSSTKKNNLTIIIVIVVLCALAVFSFISLLIILYKKKKERSKGSEFPTPSSKVDVESNRRTDHFMDVEEKRINIKETNFLENDKTNMFIPELTSDKVERHSKKEKKKKKKKKRKNKIRDETIEGITQENEMAVTKRKHKKKSKNKKKTLEDLLE